MSRSSRPTALSRLALRTRARRLRRSAAVGSIGLFATLAAVVAGQPGHTASAATAASRRDPPQIASTSGATAADSWRSSRARTPSSSGYFDSDGWSLHAGSSSQPTVGSSHAS